MATATATVGTVTPAVTVDTVTVGAARVRYDRYPAAGPVEAPALLLVHGTGSGGAEVNWSGLAPGLATHRTVLTPDLSGTERTVDDGAPLTTEQLAAQVIAVIEHAGTGPVDLPPAFGREVPPWLLDGRRRRRHRRRAAPRPGPPAGPGGRLGAHRRHGGTSRPKAGGEYLRNLFTVWRRIADHDAEAFGRIITITGFSHGFLNTIGRAGVEQLVPNMPPTAGTLRHIELDLRVDIRELLPRITAPTLVIGFTQDATVPVAHSRALHAAIAGSRYAELDAGHVGVFERAEEFTALVDGFTRSA
ncbi:alpha/beta fold hydrolase [Kitasatospora viridis]|uniref:Pimeloyl-ACP methyl ester carboxylesterase n=1 Tax=Kitasatospora viridis TaxID=281105 RepID=A0A561TTQ3_9ACTN|nr:alpha/beta hydrolase [Kitasatospora viridis]TWF90505.1 pimeloyl-ACP methyl ester carboxylesterase [Kitasatospora viridis]